jgi:dolichyl-phosphate beta-glucosyltransferase
MGLFGLGRIDTMCGFKGYRQPVAKKLFSNLIEPRWLFDTEVAYKAVRQGYSITNFPIHWESKDGSKLGTLTLFKSALGIYPLIAKIKRLQ